VLYVLLDFDTTLLLTAFNFFNYMIALLLPNTFYKLKCEGIHRGIPAAKAYYNNSLGSVTTPVTAAAAATNGLAKSVRAPGP
jgi:hypothetical protein